MTTNHIESLDKALIRPGRVDFRALIDNATLDQARRMFMHFYNNSDLCEEFVETLRLIHQRIEVLEEDIPMDISPAQIQGYFIAHKESPRDLVEYLKECAAVTNKALKESGGGGQDPGGTPSPGLAGSGEKGTAPLQNSTN